MVQDNPPAGAALAAFLSGPGRSLVPDEARHEARRAVLGFLTCALAGTADPAYAAARTVALRHGGDGPARLVDGGRSDIATAVFLNAIAGNVLDFDDTHLPTVIHPSAPVVPVLLALAERLRPSGRAFLDDLVLSFEAMARLGLSVHPDHYRAGWHITATCGVVGAAVAACLATGLPPDRTAAAIGIAAGQAAGLIGNLAEGAKVVPVGNAARNGLLSAEFAAAGLSAAPAILEGRFGFLDVLSRGSRPEALVDGLGERWEILSNTHKPWPTGVVLNPVIDACLALREDGRVRPGAIAAVSVEGHPLLVDRTDRPSVATTADARLSVQHTVAVTLLHGPPGLAAFRPDRIADPAVAALRALVSVRAAEDVPVSGARLSVALAGGGTAEVPMTDDDLVEKLVATLAGRADEAALLALAGRVLGLGEDGEPADLLAALPRLAASA